MATLDISKLAAYLEKKKQDLGKGTLLALTEVSNDIIMRTPVDEGGARGSWTPDINKMSANHDDLDPTGRKSISEVSNKLRPFKLGDTYYLLSNLVYMPKLEYGYSNQAPTGMVRTSLDNFERHLDEALK